VNVAMLASTGHAGCGVLAEELLEQPAAAVPTIAIAPHPATTLHSMNLRPPSGLTLRVLPRAKQAVT
jgi:hypothetical protein